MNADVTSAKHGLSRIQYERDWFITRAFTSPSRERTFFFLITICARVFIRINLPGMERVLRESLGSRQFVLSSIQTSRIVLPRITVYRLQMQVLHLESFVLPVPHKHDVFRYSPKHFHSRRGPLEISRYYNIFSIKNSLVLILICNNTTLYIYKMISCFQITKYTVI